MPKINSKYSGEVYDFHVVYPIDQSIIRQRQLWKVYPFTRTKGVICPPKLFTRSEILTTSLNTSKPNQSAFSSRKEEILEIIHIILPTMFGLGVSPATAVDELDFGLGI